MVSNSKINGAVMVKYFFLRMSNPTMPAIVALSRAKSAESLRINLKDFSWAA